jgi:YggT family protein
LLSVVVLAAFGLVRMAISGMTGLVIVYAILSWVQTQSVAADFLERLVLPVLDSHPPCGAADRLGSIYQPLVLLLILQVAGIVLGSMQAAVLFAI